VKLGAVRLDETTFAWHGQSARAQRNVSQEPRVGAQAMKLVQIFLPVRDNRGRKFKPDPYARIRRELVHRFGGLTAYTRSPARGLWKTGQATKRDDMIILEVMTARVDRAWWRRYRRKLETMFRQDTIVVRAQTIEVI
jgi:hypothetical protein